MQTDETRKQRDRAKRYNKEVVTRLLAMQMHIDRLHKLLPRVNAIKPTAANAIVGQVRELSKVVDTELATAMERAG